MSASMRSWVSSQSARTPEEEEETLESEAHEQARQQSAWSGYLREIMGASPAEIRSARAQRDREKRKKKPQAERVSAEDRE